MPIHGLTDHARFPVIGVLRKGAKKPNEKRPGKDLTHFRFTSEEPGLEELFLEAYGAEPRQLEVYLPYGTTDEVFDAYLEEYVAGGLLRRCTGEACILWRDETTGEMSDAERPCQASEGCQCKETGRLHVILPELEHLSAVIVTTTSKHDIMNLYGSLKRYELIARQSGGDLTGIPFTLKRVARKISTPGPGGKRARREKWLLAIEPATRWVSLQLETARARALQEGVPGQLGAPEPKQISDGREVVVEVGGEGKAVPISGAAPTVIKELQTLCSDFGFTSETRDLRIAFGNLILGESLTSFSQATGDEAEALGYAIEHVFGYLSSKQERVAFARYCVDQGLPLENMEEVDEALRLFAAPVDEVFPGEDWDTDSLF